MATGGIDTGVAAGKVESPLEYLIRVRADSTADVHRYITSGPKLGEVVGMEDLPVEDAKALHDGLGAYCLTAEEKAAKAAK